MKHRLLFALLLAPVVMLSSACSQPIKPFDVKGVWKATKGECGNYCKFIITNEVDQEEPNKLFIIFVDRPGKEAEGYVFKRSQERDKENEWSFDFVAGTGYLYQKGQQLISVANITYEKISSLEEAKKKAAAK